MVLTPGELEGGKNALRAVCHFGAEGAEGNGSKKAVPLKM